MGDAELDGEEVNTKPPYPKAVLFIIGNVFCERFNNYGMKTILVLYLNKILLYSQDTATIIYHVFTMVVYTMCIVGAMIADSWLGKYRTVAYLSLLYVSGSIILTLGAITPLKLPMRSSALIGLWLIALGSGMTKPCITAFGGDQFKLPQQARETSMFFSLYYFSTSAASFLATIVTPYLRADVYCFGNEHCFSAAFGVPALLMIASIVIFVLGRSFYIVKTPEGNTFLLVCKAIVHAIIVQCKERKTNPQEHFLDYAIPKHGYFLISDIKVLLRILVLYIPIPLFWALFDQQGSRWIFQAAMMDGHIGDFRVKPEQMQLISPLLILILIPICNLCLYPILKKINLGRPLQKLTIGGFIAGLAFIVSGFVELAVRPTYGEQPSNGFSQLRIFNGLACDLEVRTDIPNIGEFSLGAMSHFQALRIDVKHQQSFVYRMYSIGGKCASSFGTFQLESSKAISYFITGDISRPKAKRIIDSMEKSDKGNAEIRVLANTKDKVYFIDETERKIQLKPAERVQLEPESYVLKVGNKPIWKHNAEPGDVITVLVGVNGQHKPIRISSPNTVSIFWQIPQIFLMTLGEVLFSVTGLQFSYAQAPTSMKSVIQAFWLLTVAVGNLIVAIIAHVKFFENQAYEFFLFAILMFLDMVLFIFLALKYVPNDPTKYPDTFPGSIEVNPGNLAVYRVV